MVVLFTGGRGLLLLNERHPPSASGNNRTVIVKRMEEFP
jgi:hypothetical protein